MGGLSNHWKNWNSKQIEIIKEISKTNFHEVGSNDIIILNGPNFSKLGFINHIEFLAMPWIVEAILKKNKTLDCLSLLKNQCKVYNLNNHSLIDNGFYIDKKYKETINIRVEDKKIFFYDFQKKTLNRSDILTIKEKITMREKDIRHWALSPYFKKILIDYNNFVPLKIKMYLN